MLSHTIGINMIRKHTKAGKLMFLTSQFGLKHLIQEPKHILTYSSSCVNVIFTSQLYLVMESGVHSSLHQNCHNQLIYAKINLKVFYLSPYEREIWHYQRTNVDLIQQAIEQFSCEKSFRNLNINEMVFLFNKTINFFFQISFFTKKSLVMTEIHLGLRKTSNS